MYLFPSEFSALSGFAEIPGPVHLKIYDQLTGQLIFSNTYHAQGVHGYEVTWSIKNLSNIIAEDISARDTYLRTYRFDIEPPAAHLHVWFGMDANNQPITSKLLTFLADNPNLGGMGQALDPEGATAADQFLKLSPLLRQSEFTLIDLPSTNPFYQYLSKLELTVHADGGTIGVSGPSGNYLHKTQFYRTSSPVTQQTYLSQGWHTLTITPDSYAPLNLIALDKSPLEGDMGQALDTEGSPKIISISTLSIEPRALSLHGIALFQFKNRHNILEPALLQGSLSITPKAESQSIAIGRKTRRIDIRRQDQYTLTISNLQHKRATELTALLYSDKVRLMLPGSQLLPAAANQPIDINIESIDADINQSSDSLPSLKISFSLP